jgi:hypothetical protein
LPWLLVSGGDDSRLILWDIRSNEKAFETKEPSVSVSCIDSHPSKPFLYATSHFDNSLFFWDILALAPVRTALCKILLNFSYLEYTCDPHDGMDPKLNARISGGKSVSMAMGLGKLRDLPRFKAALQLFMVQEGAAELLSILTVLKEQQPGDPDLKVLHIADAPFAM